ncbi:MAG TPA: EutN/CcmL family microcompartment protein [Bacteroidales bacterium]|nr:EutN/CcmL family microcompartment protein [Bacteroidales bacterium]
MGIVVGTVICSQYNVGISGARFLLVEKCNQRASLLGDYLVALDLLGAGNGEMVMLSESTSARETPLTKGKPIDTLIVGIIDLIDQEDQVVYRK